MSEELLDRYANQLRIHQLMVESGKKLQECLELIPSAEDQPMKIMMGLLNKLVKLHKSIARNIVEADTLTTSILMRVFFETSVSLGFLLKRLNDDDFKEFVRHDAQHRKLLIKFYESSTLLNDEEKRALKKKMIEDIQSDEIDYESLGSDRIKASWHREFTYYQMAAEQGEETEKMFQTLYGATSAAVHPSWSNIKALHIQPNPEDPTSSIPKDDAAAPIFLELSVLACLAFSVSTNFASYSGDGQQLALYSNEMHQELHSLANPQPNNGNPDSFGTINA